MVELGASTWYVNTMPCGILEPRIAFDVAWQYHQNPALIEPQVVHSCQKGPYHVRSCELVNRERREDVLRMRVPHG